MYNEINTQKWRFWPVILLSSFYTINASLIMLGIPILFFQKGTSIEIIGFLSAAQIIAYCFSPLVFNKVSDRLGRKKSLIIAMVGTSFSQITYYLVLEPFVFLIARFTEGLFLGFFAPNLQASISDNPILDHSKYLSRLSLSFNSGSLVGLLFGALFLLFINDIILIFYVAPLLIIANAIIAIIFFQESTKLTINSGIIESAQIYEINSGFNNSNKSNELVYHIPVLIPIIFLFGFSFAIGSANFIYPIKSEILGFQSSSAYFLSFVAMFAQTFSVYKASLWSIKRLKVASLISITLVALIIIFFGINDHFYGFIILFVLIGIFAGILYGSAIKFFIILNLTKQTSKYSSIMESLSGITYFVTQITAGLIGGLSLELAFYTLSIILIFISILYFLSMKRIKEI
ncbi:MAG: MFS transporter [Candidatus Thorarchaeota archaeon]